MGLTAWERRGSAVVHAALYGLLLVLPLLGWAAVSASPLNIPTVLFGAIPWPHLPGFAGLADRGAVAEVLEDVHGDGAFVMMLVAGLHISSEDQIYTTEMFQGRIQVFQYLAQQAAPSQKQGGDAH